MLGFVWKEPKMASVRGRAYEADFKTQGYQSRSGPWEKSSCEKSQHEYNNGTEVEEASH